MAWSNVLQRILQNWGLMSRLKWLFNSDFKACPATGVGKMAEYHPQHQDQTGVTKAVYIVLALLDLPENLANQFIEDLVEQKALVSRGWLHLPEHRIEFERR